jgi:hypothetical protein
MYSEVQRAGVKQLEVEVFERQRLIKKLVVAIFDGVQRHVAKQHQQRIYAKAAELEQDHTRAVDSLNKCLSAPLLRPLDVGCVSVAVLAPSHVSGLEALLSMHVLHALKERGIQVTCISCCWACQMSAICSTVWYNPEFL